ncbi:MAG: DNA polymerase III subunit delta' C-terminal domain-containing protein [Lachnospiraceae bacterium]
METFRDILGQTSIKEHFRYVLDTGKISHAYILCGEKGSGKKLLTNTFVRAAQCEKGGVEPCNECKSCKQALNGNHPDIISLVHEKPNTITVEEVRRQINSDIAIKPYSRERKFYIIDEAEKMNVQAQNALLKTLEEPPSYATIFILTTNLEAMLQTIKSRCILFHIKTVSDYDIKHFLMSKKQVPDYSAKLCVSFARGNVGRALALASSEEFEELKTNTLRLLQTIEEKSISDLNKSAKELADKKYDIQTCFDIMLLWYRDILLYKSSNTTKHLIFSDEVQYIRKIAQSNSFECLNYKLDSLQEVQQRLAYNVNTELSIEWMLLVLSGGI